MPCCTIVKHPPIDWPIPMRTASATGGNPSASEPSASASVTLATVSRVGGGDDAERELLGIGGRAALADEQVVAAHEDPASPRVPPGLTTVRPVRDVAEPVGHVEGEVLAAVATAGKPEAHDRWRAQSRRVGEGDGRLRRQRFAEARRVGDVDGEVDRFGHARHHSAVTLRRATPDD